MSLNKFFSSGGTGDCWLQMIKLLQQINVDDKVVWNHASSHEFHRDAVIQLMALVPGIIEANFHIVTRATMSLVESQYVDENTTRLTSTAFDIINPLPDLTSIIKPVELKKPIAIVQPAAGRDDESIRYFTPYAVNTLIENFQREGKDVVLLGQKYTAATPDGVNNLTGKTNVKTALSIIASANDFIGFDGFLAYAAMAMGVRSRVAFRAPGISYHYIHPEWRKRSEFCLTYPKINEPFCLNWGQV